MHYLVPQFIVDNYRQDIRRGRFFAVCQFVDISGFSEITDDLMKHGPHGAEILTGLIRNIFDPLLRSVYEHGGFAATLAGDAFTAVFPAESDSEEGQLNAARQGIVAAWRIQQRMQDVTLQVTPYGDFRVSVKVGVACGDVNWGIVTSEDERRASYYFQGPAIDGSAEAEHAANAGDIIIGARLHDLIGPMVNAEPLADQAGNYQRLRAVSASAPAVELSGPRSADFEVMTRFFPSSVVYQEHSGEFRQVLNLFINLPTVRTEDQLAIFMRSMFALQDRYGGLLNRLDFGDKGSNLLLFWGAPVAHENDVARILNFVLDLQTVTSIPINAGITYRLAHAGFVGSAQREEYTCYGRGVNLAARFMTAAPRGEIWLDERVAQHAERNFEIEYEGEMAFKGFAEKQKVYALFEIKEEDETFYDGPMVGRQAEIEIMTDFVAPLWRDQPAGALIVWGEAGMGKSRLVHEFHHSDMFGEVDVLWAVCQSDEILRESLNPFRYWLIRYFNQSQAQSEARNKRNFNRKLDGLISETSSQWLAAELDRTRSFLGAMLGLYWPDSLYAGLDAQRRYENTLGGLMTLMQAESQRQPLIVHIEDNQWIDEASREFMVHLATSLRDDGDETDPIAIIATSRHEGPGCPLAEADQCLEIDLAQLSPESLAELAQDLLNGPVSQSLLDLIVARAEGNPFFAEQILRYLRESDSLAVGPDGWQLRKEGRTPLPADVRSVLIARLDRLAQEVRDLVQTAAVLGREFEVLLLARMLRDDNSVIDRVEEAQSAAIWSQLNQMRYLFKHALLRDTAYRMQVRTRREALHKLAAQAIETLYADDLRPHYAELAYHCERAGSMDEAADWYMLAAAQATNHGTLVDARSYLTRAVDLVPAERADMRWSALTRQIKVLNMLGEFEASLKVEETTLTLAQEIGDDALMAEAYFLRAVTAHEMGNDRTALGDFEVGLLASKRGGARRIEALILGMKTIALARTGQIEEAAVVAEGALAMAEELGEEYVLVRNLNNLANFYMYIGDHGQAADHLTRQVDINRRQGDRVVEATGLTNLAYNQLALGRYDAAQAAIEGALQLTTLMGASRLSAYNRLNLGLALVRLGRPADALREIEAARPELIAVGDRFGLSVTYTYMGLALEADRQADQAAASYEEAVEMLRQIDAAGYAIDAVAGRSRCALIQEDLQLAEVLAVEIWEYLRQSGASGLEFPLLAYESCARAFEAAGNEAAFRSTVEAGYRELMDRAKRISDGEWRSALLHNVPEHRALGEMWERLQT